MPTLSLALPWLLSSLLLLADAPGGATSLLEQGERLFREGDIAGAVAAFDEAAKVDPKDARGRLPQGCRAREERRRRGGAGRLQAAIARKADFAEPHNNLGALLLARNDTAAAPPSSTRR